MDILCDFAQKGWWFFMTIKERIESLKEDVGSLKLNVKDMEAFNEWLKFIEGSDASITPEIVDKASHATDSPITDETVQSKYDTHHVDTQKKIDEAKRQKDVEWGRYIQKIISTSLKDTIIENIGDTLFGTTFTEKKQMRKWCVTNGLFKFVETVRMEDSILAGEVPFVLHAKKDGDKYIFETSDGRPVELIRPNRDSRLSLLDNEKGIVDLRERKNDGSMTGDFWSVRLKESGKLLPVRQVLDFDAIMEGRGLFALLACEPEKVLEMLEANPCKETILKIAEGKEVSDAEIDKMLRLTLIDVVDNVREKIEGDKTLDEITKRNLLSAVAEATTVERKFSTNPELLNSQMEHDRKINDKIAKARENHEIADEELEQLKVIEDQVGVFKMHDLSVEKRQYVESVRRLEQLESSSVKDTYGETLKTLYSEENGVAKKLKDIGELGDAIKDSVLGAVKDGEKAFPFSPDGTLPKSESVDGKDTIYTTVEGHANALDFDGDPHHQMMGIYEDTLMQSCAKIFTGGDEEQFRQELARFVANYDNTGAHRGEVDSSGTYMGVIVDAVDEAKAELKEDRLAQKPLDKQIELFVDNYVDEKRREYVEDQAITLARDCIAKDKVVNPDRYKTAEAEETELVRLSEEFYDKISGMYSAEDKNNTLRKSKITEDFKARKREERSERVGETVEKVVDDIASKVSKGSDFDSLMAMGTSKKVDSEKSAGVKDAGKEGDAVTGTATHIETPHAETPHAETGTPKEPSFEEKRDALLKAVDVRYDEVLAKRGGKKLKRHPFTEKQYEKEFEDAFVTSFAGLYRDNEVKIGDMDPEAREKEQKLAENWINEHYLDPKECARMRKRLEKNKVPAEERAEFEVRVQLLNELDGRKVSDLTPEAKVRIHRNINNKLRARKDIRERFCERDIANGSPLLSSIAGASRDKKTASTSGGYSGASFSSTDEMLEWLTKAVEYMDGAYKSAGVSIYKTPEAPAPEKIITPEHKAESPKAESKKPVPLGVSDMARDVVFEDMWVTLDKAFKTKSTYKDYVGKKNLAMVAMASGHWPEDREAMAKYGMTQKDLLEHMQKQYFDTVKNKAIRDALRKGEIKLESGVVVTEANISSADSQKAIDDWSKKNVGEIKTVDGKPVVDEKTGHFIIVKGDKDVIGPRKEEGIFGGIEKGESLLTPQGVARYVVNEVLKGQNNPLDPRVGDAKLDDRRKNSRLYNMLARAGWSANIADVEKDIIEQINHEATKDAGAFASATETSEETPRTTIAMDDGSEKEVGVKKIGDKEFYCDIETGEILSCKNIEERSSDGIGKEITDGLIEKYGSEHKMKSDSEIAKAKDDISKVELGL